MKRKNGIESSIEKKEKRKINGKKKNGKTNFLFMLIFLFEDNIYFHMERGITRNSTM